MKHINIVFKNSIQIEGHLLSTEDNEMTIQSLDGLSVITVPDIKDNILFYKISSFQEEYDTLVEKPDKSTEDLKRMVALKSNLNNIERASIREKMQAPLPPLDIIKKEQNVKYDQQISSITKHSKKETIRTNSGFNSELQRVFSKKH